jgi:hypothetical protein
MFLGQSKRAIPMGLENYPRVLNEAIDHQTSLRHLLDTKTCHVSTEAPADIAIYPLVALT